MTEGESGKTRLKKALYLLFLLSLLLIGWGTLGFSMPGVPGFGLEGSTWESMVPLFFLFFICRLVEGRSRGGAWWREPVPLLCCFAALSVLWCPLHDYSLVLYVCMPAFMGYSILRSLLREFPLWRQRLWPYLAAAVSLMVIRGIISRPEVLFSKALLDTPFFHHNHVAMACLLVLPFVLSSLAERRGKSTGYGLALLLILLGLVLATSRSGWLALGVTLGYLILAQGDRRLKAAALVAGIIFAMFMMFFSVSRTRLATFHALDRDAGVHERLVIWKVSARIFVDHPLLGIGFSNSAYSSIEKEYFQKFHLKRRLPFEFSGPPHPHNLFLQVAVYLGLTGLLLFAFLLVRTWKDIDSQGRDDAGSSALCCRASLAGFLIINLFDTVFNSPQVTLFWFLILAFIHEHGENRCTPGTMVKS